MPSDAAFAFIEELERRRDVPALLEAFQLLIQNFGLQNYWIGDPSQPHVNRKDRIWAVNWPEGWLKRYAEQRYQLVDLILQRMNLSAEPFRWHEALADATTNARKMMNEARAFGLADGFAVPLYGVDGSAIGISLGGERYDLSKRDEAALHMAVIYFHARLARLRLSTEAPRKVARLTPRERECLSWVAAGKTDWEIAQILEISEQTAHEYVQNAISKLNAATRAQAVAVAILTRQILQ